MKTVQITAAHQRSIGVAIASMEALLRELCAGGVDGETAAGLEAVLGEITDKTGATRPSPRPGERHAKLAQLLVHALELDSRHLRAYGPLSEEAERYFDEQSRRLSELTERLMDQAAS